MLLRLTILWMLALSGCGKSSAPSQPKTTMDDGSEPTPTAFFAAFEECTAGLEPIPTTQLEEQWFHAAWSACAPLVGDGACRAAWGELPQAYAKNDALIGRRLTSLIEACAKQHCPSLSASKPTACTTSPADWAPERQNTIWAELHAAILAKVFPDEIRIPESLQQAYATLSESPSPREFRAFFAKFPSPGSVADGVDGRAVIFGTVGKFLSALLLPSNAWALPQRLPPR